jgi:hypothetical protein
VAERQRVCQLTHTHLGTGIRELMLGNREMTIGELRTKNEGQCFLKPNARLPPSGVTACGVLWVEPGDPMTRRPSSIVLI